MTKHLFLLRHAASEEKQPDQPDIQRSLTTIGMRQAAQLGAHLHKRKDKIDIIYASTAQRALRTAELIHDAMKDSTIAIQAVEDLYEASTRTFLSFVRSLDNDLNNVMCVGHNPVITYLAEHLTKAEIGDVTACGLAIILFELQGWSQVNEATGELVQYIHPGLIME